MTSDTAPASWWAKGLLFENCNCTTVCPGHVHFEQACTHERCKGYWAIRFRDGALGGVSLAGVDAVVAYDSPQRMIDGGWTEVILVGEGATAEQVEAVEAILTGVAGGPWEILARFVGRRLPTRRAPMHIVEEARTKRIRVEGILESTVEAIRGRDRSKPVTFENMFNQVHATTQVIARGTSSLDNGVVTVTTDQTHGLWSDFHWVVSGE
jgi:hypothetical protein